MRFSAFFVQACVAAALGFGAAPSVTAQTVSDIGGPAEAPPASYSANQYVDSRGCVFIRAGFGGQTNWVPRVSRSREVLCGYQPSLPVQTAAPPAPQTRPAAQAPARTATVAPRPSTVAPRPQTAAAAPQPGATSGQVFRPAGSANTAGSSRPQPSRSVTTIRQEPAAPTRVATSGVAPNAATSCPNAPASAQPYLRGDGLRCGPQPQHPGDLARNIAGQAIGGGARSSRPGPRISAADAVIPVQPHIPDGYRMAWDDGRLNPNRGPRTAYGDQQMAMIWTDGLPRQQVQWVRATDANGQPVYVSRMRQNTAGVSGSIAPAPVVSTRNPAAAAVPGTRTRTVTGPRLDAPSSRATPESAEGHRFVLVGRYGSQADARIARDRLAAGGLGASIGQSERGGRTNFVVLAGPYGDAASLSNALQTARGAGFSGAMTRR
jgi:hypothetical protein